MNNDCLFCKIVAGEIPSTKIFENPDFIAILDLYPNTKGQTVIIPKKHVSSDMLDLNNEDFTYAHLGLDTAKIVAKILKDKLKPSRVALVTEGVFVDHLHLKLFPLYNTEQHSTGIDSQHVFFESFPGYVTTQGGKMWSREELENLAQKITN